MPDPLDACRVKRPAQHTPGPWRVYPIGACVPHYDVCMRVVSDHPTGRCDFDPPSDADAHLIAASPELLKSLQDLLRETAGGSKPCAGVFVHNACEAIAKALGSR